MRRVVSLLCFLVALTPAFARTFTVLVYNVENLVDADGQALFEDYAASRYSPAHCLTKLQNISKIVAQFDGGRGPDVILFAEFEVDHTPAAAPLNYTELLRRYESVKIEEMLGAKFTPEIGDLPAEALLLKAFADRGLVGYHVAVGENIKTADSKHPLAQTCAVFTRFPIRSITSHPTLDARAILEVLIDVEGAPLYVFANHWKSGASDPATEPIRAANARTLRTRLTEILRQDPNADVIIGGDLNSQYNHKRRYPQIGETGINDVLGSQGNELAVRSPQRDLYNLWYELPAEARGSDTFRGEWGTLMHLIVTRGLYDFRGVQYVDNSFRVAKFSGLNADAAGLPVRWSGDGPTGSGFSDHFPISAEFKTVTDGRADRYLSLRQPSAERAEEPVAKKIDYAAVDLANVAVTAAKLSPGVNVRDGTFNGKLFRVEGKVAPGARLAVEFRGEIYDIWSFDEALRNKLRADYQAGDSIRFYGELGSFRGRWQFVVQDPNWVK